MSYPRSPFRANFDTSVLFKLGTEGASVNGKVDVDGLLAWLCTAPKITTYRVNTITHAVDQVFELLKGKLAEICSLKIEKHDVLGELIVIHHKETPVLNLEEAEKEVVVDTKCAASVLRGSHIYAPGVLAMMKGTKQHEKVKIYVDLAKNCKRGFLERYDGDKLLIAVGKVEMIRRELFGDTLKPVGTAIKITETISGCPTMGNCVPEGSALLQNLPSVACVHALRLEPGLSVLDMCASPGNKTTHIAALLKNQGTLIAIDKTSNKVNRLRETCKMFSSKVQVLQADSTRILDATLRQRDLSMGPPFSKESFDRILLDAPCSALGQRPQFSKSISLKSLNSYVPLQRKLFHNAVRLLRLNGILVYSTCTITLAENEGIVAWALKTFHCLQLIKCEPHLGGTGLSIEGLNTEDQNMVQRFGPGQRYDTVGFFVACFMKK